jgi:hypothetical protein
VLNVGMGPAGGGEVKALVWRGPVVGTSEVSLLDWEHGQPEDRYGVEWAIENNPPPVLRGLWLYTGGGWRRLTDTEAAAVSRGAPPWVELFSGEPDLYTLVFDDGEGPDR